MFEQEYVSTGCTGIDELLGGGFERGVVTQLYGPPGIGKTNLAMAAIVECAANDDTSVVIDTEGLSMARFQQMSDGRGVSEEALQDNVEVQEVYDFAGQKTAVQEAEVIAADADVLVLDSATGFYRLEREEDGGDSGEALREIARQVTKLLSLARKHDLAVVVTNQVYAGVEDRASQVQPLGGNTLEHWTGTVVRLEEQGDNRRAVLEKHRSQEQGQSAEFEIVDSGLQNC